MHGCAARLEITTVTRPVRLHVLLVAFSRVFSNHFGRVAWEKSIRVDQIHRRDVL